MKKTILLLSLVLPIVTIGCHAKTNVSSQEEGAEYSPKFSDAFDMRYGIFIHWVGCPPDKGSGIVYSNGKSISEGTIDDYAESFNVEK